MGLLKNSTDKQTKWWAGRKIDWAQAYLSTWDHPHRRVLVDFMRPLEFYSVWEIGCAAGANLVKLTKSLGRKIQVGGCDVSADAIEVAKMTMPGALFQVESGENMLMTDKSVDLVLTDMTLIYVGPTKIKTYIKEMKRIARNRVVFCELYHPSWWMRWKLRRYHVHDYPKLLAQAGFWDIIVEKLPESAWPGGQPQKDYGYLITARV